MDWWELVIPTQSFSSLSVSLFLFHISFPTWHSLILPFHSAFVSSLSSYSFSPLALYILQPALSIMHLLMGSLPLPTAALLTYPVNMHSRCACVWKRAEEVWTRLYPVGLCVCCITAFLSVLSHLSICPSVRLSNQLSLSLSECFSPAPTGRSR